MYAHSNKKEKIQVLYKVKSSSYSEQKINTKKKKIKMEYIPHTSKEVIDPSTERTIPHHLWNQLLGHTQIVCSQIIGPEKHQFSTIKGKACNIWTNLYTSITSYRFQTYIYNYICIRNLWLCIYMKWKVCRLFYQMKTENSMCHHNYLSA